MEYEIISEGMHYEGNCIRPPSEAYSILLQVTVGCSHNKCTFCGAYKGEKFKIKENRVIFSDILFASKYMKQQNRLFLMDGDALIIPQKRLIPIMDKIREHLPWVKRVGTYANAKSIRMKSQDELIELRKRGMKIFYLGAESGDDEVLKHVCKGTDSEGLIDVARKTKDAGIKLSVTVLLGIGGRKRSLAHARATGDILSEMDPDYVGALTLMLVPGTPLFDEFEKGRFELPSEKEILVELKEMIRHTNLSRGLFLSNHASNYLPIKARLPKGKQQAMDLIERAIDGDVELRPEWMRGL